LRDQLFHNSTGVTIIEFTVHKSPARSQNMPIASC